jgi:hypothetical protein
MAAMRDALLEKADSGEAATLREQIFQLRD